MNLPQSFLKLNVEIWFLWSENHVVKILDPYPSPIPCYEQKCCCFLVLTLKIFIFANFQPIIKYYLIGIFRNIKEILYSLFFTSRVRSSPWNFLKVRWKNYYIFVFVTSNTSWILPFEGAGCYVYERKEDRMSNKVFNFRVFFKNWEGLVKKNWERTQNEYG